MENKVVVFDFDKTLTFEDTVFSFFLNVAEKKFYFIFKFLFYFILMILYKFRVISNSTLKRIGVYLFLRNQSLSILTEKSLDFIKKIKFNELFKSYDFNNPSEEIYIVSASFEIYLKLIFQDSVKIIGSKLITKEGVVQSVGVNCFGEKKVELLNNENIKRIDKLYTDSLSDLPLAKISSSITIVSGDSFKKCNNYSDFKNILK